jgi:hypothetical protein
MCCMILMRLQYTAVLCLQIHLADEVMCSPDVMLAYPL